MERVSAKRVSGLNKRVSKREINALAKQIAQKFDPDRIILFGSYAYGKPKPWSDVDLLVVMDTPLRNVEQAVQIALSTKPRYGVDLIVRNARQIEERMALGDFFIRDIVQKGKVLYARANA